MLKTISMTLTAGAFLALASTAHAFSPAPANLPTPEVSDVEHVAQGCGRGWARNRYGRCVPIASRGPVVIGRPVVVCRSVRTAWGWRRVCR